MRWILIGGFLGAGKTTAIIRLARRLAARGRRVSVVSNDQGHRLVDTATVRSQGFDAEEVSGGCFCCRFDSLIEASRRLADEARPDVVIAEPVGSCTDLKATVAYPLRTIHRDEFEVAPVSVLLDPIRALQAFGLANGGCFSPDVLYIYKKQIEEADLIVISKCDLMSAPRLSGLHRALAEEFPGKPGVAVSPREGTNLEDWFVRLETGEPGCETAMEVNYEAYARGEALLGWFNATVQFASIGPFDADDLLEKLAWEIQHRLRLQHSEIAHLKISFSSEPGCGAIGLVNLVRNDSRPEHSIRLARPARGGELILNLRAEADPETLSAAVQESLAAVAESFPGLNAVFDHLERFRPGKPMPTHRMKGVPA